MKYVWAAMLFFFTIALIAPGINAGLVKGGLGRRLGQDTRDALAIVLTLVAGVLALYLMRRG